jgi:hypothetical protein
MSKESPIHGYSELDCYKKALKIREVIGQKGRITANAAGKRTNLSEMQVIKIVQTYYRTSMMVIPYGQTARIMMRPLKGMAS